MAKLFRLCMQSSGLLSRRFSISTIKAATQKPATEPENNEPVKYYGSAAASWKAQQTRSGGSEATVWFQPYVISLSLAVFLIYFCILREENDIDQELEKSLFERVDGLEQTQLILAYRYNKENGLDLTALETRMAELDGYPHLRSKDSKHIIIGHMEWRNYTRP